MQEQFMYDEQNPICEVCNKNDKAKYSSMCQECIDAGWRIKDIYTEPYEYEKIMNISGMLAIGNGEKCPFCDLIKEEDTDIFSHLNDKHKKEFNEALFNE